MIPPDSMPVRDDVDIVRMTLPGCVGMTDGEHVIVLDPSLTEVEERCAYAHELAHIVLGHRGGASYREEAEAKMCAARWLVPLPSLLDAMRGAERVDEIAETLGVTADVVLLRVAHLHPSERKKLHRSQYRVQLTA